MPLQRWWRRFFVVAALLVLVAAGVSEAFAASDSRAHRPQLPQGRIVAIALAAATRAGDPHPSLIQHVEGTRQRANAVDSGDIVAGGQWSYLIAERGRFVFVGVAPSRTPDGGSVYGSVLTLVVNARTGEVTDSGLSNRYPAMSKLGPVVTDQHIK
jgi:hypothetical protein